MKKVILIGCIMFIVFCAPKKTTVETEDVEEVIVFGEEDVMVSEEPVLPEPIPEAEPPVLEEEPVVPIEEEVITPPVIEEEPIAPPIEEEVTIIPPPVEEPIAPTPPIEEEIAVIPPPAEEPVTVTPPVAPSRPPEQILGFRVQIFASSTDKNASRVADDAQAALGENVYVEHIAPYYKVRVGDCLTREDAETLKNKALRHGYTGAFVVETMITP